MQKLLSNVLDSFRSNQIESSMREVGDPKNESGDSAAASDRFRDYADADAAWFCEFDPFETIFIISASIISFRSAVI